MKPIFFFLLALFPLLALAQSAIDLPAPQKRIGMDLMQALQQRQSSREFAADTLSRQRLSDLLWAAFGINRPESGKRTAPSSMNRQEIEIYAALAQGLYRYDAAEHRLLRVHDRDIRAETGGQDFVAQAPLNLVYVADFDRLRQATDAEKRVTAACNSGFISQNVYLYCAAAGLATVVRGWFDEEKLALAMELPDHLKIVLTQTVGHPRL
ncbi:SagB/ThcOx family dehydrogenase [candidate division KSB1 bacterium]|nr:SagB/ThcOx family dehydrogenase [candidate division KSB1 bacterium]